MRGIAAIAERYGSGTIRLTVWQNLIVSDIAVSDRAAVQAALAEIGLAAEASAVRAGLVACTGNTGCKFSATDTKRHAVAIADHLDAKLKLEGPLNIHLTGCPNSCAQHYIGDIGLLGAKVKVAGETVEGYHVFVGGGFGGNQAVGRQVFQGISFEQLKPTLERILIGYLRHRQPGES